MNKVTDEMNLDYKGKNDTIGERIGYIRRLRGKKQAELANELHIERTILSYYEQNKRKKIPLDIIIDISKILDVPTDYLLGINEIEENDKERQKIGNTLGLSSKAIKVLEEMKKYNASQLETIDFLIRQEENYPISSFIIETPANITQEELNKLEKQEFEKYERKEKEWEEKHSTIISAIDKYFNIAIQNEELLVTENSIKKEKDFVTQLQKALHTKKKIDIKEVVDTALLKDIEKELEKAKKYMERRKQSKK